MRKIILTVFSLIMLSASALRAEEGRLLRFPSTNGETVVFSYAGDLYKAPINGGEAVRLTSSLGYDMFSKFSPDGKTIAFTGQYDGNTEVYTLPLEGGSPERLTYTSTNSRDDLGDRMGPNNIVMGWSPDGKTIIYRNRIGDGFPGKLWTVPVEGGMSQRVPLPEGGFCSWSPDGKKLAYNRTFREFRTWKYYRGGQADDIWIWDGNSVKNITNNPAQDIMPMWIGDEIFFISDRDHTMNLFVYNLATGKTEKLTDFSEYDIKFPSSNGKMIVFENGGYIYKFNPGDRKYSKINITLNPEALDARPERKKLDSYRSSASISSKGDRLAVTARGEVFSVPVKSGVTKNITKSSNANDRGAMYSPDGKHIAYISDITGETEVWLYDTATEKSRQLTKDNDTYIRDLYWSPDSKTLLYTDRKNRLMKVDPATGDKTIIATNPMDEFRDVIFAPDSKWISYTKTEANEMSVVYVMNLESGENFPVTEKWYDSRLPVFSQDGKYILLTAMRDLSPIYSSVEWNYAYSTSDMAAMYMIILDPATPSPFIEKDGETVMVQPKAPAETPAAKKGKSSKADKEEAKEENSVSVNIVAEGIFDRMIKIPNIQGYAIPVYSDGKSIIYTNMAGNNKYDIETKTSSRYDNVIDVVGDKAIAVKGRELYVGDVNRGNICSGNPVYLGDMVTTVNWTEEWAQIFDEAWRAFRDGFYLENMHGIDWEAMRQKYEVLLPYAKTRLDLNYIIGEMISELHVGHAYVTPGEYDKPERIPMGLLGAEISRDDNSGYYRIDHILKGDNFKESLRSPLTENGLGVSDGDYIIAIDGVPTTSTNNIYSMLVGKADVLTELTINSKPSAEGARDIVIRPIADEYPLFHYEEILRRIEYVDEKSGGRIGYIHIPDMSAEGLNEFVRYYYPQLDKEALIIDDRSNGGGNVSPMIIERLLREPYRMTMYRNSSRTGTIPEGTFVGPKVCLIDKYSASDGDLFPWSFKATGLGTVIGTRTWGGIVGISSSLPYIDGTDIRVPFFTNYDVKTGEWIIENHGVDPDIYVDNDPIMLEKGIDQQLDKAIEVLLEQLKDRKPLPPVPAPRDFSNVGK